MGYKSRVSFSLKDQLFNSDKINFLSQRIKDAYPEFKQAAFCEKVISAFPQLELKERIAHITTVLHQQLPKNYKRATQIIVASLPTKLDPTKKDDDFGDFIFAPLSHYIATYGCNAEHLTISLNALRNITQRFSAEDAIRAFINSFPKQTLAFLSDCARDSNYHVRRLASEGTRPSLPWSCKLNTDYSLAIPILNQLYSDDTRFVTRSVANHMNDISKLNPERVVALLEEWKQLGTQDDEELSYIIEHSLRTLIKKGNQSALSTIGFGQKPSIEIEAFAIQSTNVKMGDYVEFSFCLHSNKKQNLLVDYIIRFAGPSGPGGKKVFKLKRCLLTANESILINKKHAMKKMTTRTLYEGEHVLTLQINGHTIDSRKFELRI